MLAENDKIWQNLMRLTKPKLNLITCFIFNILFHLKDLRGNLMSGNIRIVYNTLSHCAPEYCVFSLNKFLLGLSKIQNVGLRLWGNHCISDLEPFWRGFLSVWQKKKKCVCNGGNKALSSKNGVDRSSDILLLTPEWLLVNLCRSAMSFQTHLCPLQYY